MWDPRFPELAAARLQESRAEAQPVDIEPSPSTFRLILGAALVRLGERLAGPVAAPVGGPAPVAR